MVLLSDLFLDLDTLHEALRQAITAKVDARVCIELGEQTLRRFAGALHVVAATQPPPAEALWHWRNERRLVIPDLHAALEMRRPVFDVLVLAIRRKAD